MGTNQFRPSSRFTGWVLLVIGLAIGLWAPGLALGQGGLDVAPPVDTFRLPEPEGELVLPAAESLPPPSASDSAAEAIPTPAPQPTGKPASQPAGSGAMSNDLAAAMNSTSWDFWSPKFWDPWEGNVELGMNGTDGNSETFNIRFGATAKYKTDWLVRSLQVTSIQKRANGATTANTALIDARLDWPMPQSKWNYFMHTLVEYDQFKAFDARISADTGFGYEFIQNDITTLIGRTGLAASNEIGGPNNKVNPELYFGGEFKHKFNATHSISAKTDYYPNVTAFGDFRLNSQASWEVALAQAWGLSLKFSVIDRYDSTPEGKRPNDLDYSTLLIWNF